MQRFLFLPKKEWRADLLRYNPYLSHIHLLEKDNFSLKIKELRGINFDYIFDLHNNLRTFWLKICLQKPVFSFKKQNWDRYLFTKWKRKTEKLAMFCRAFTQKTGKALLYDEKGLDFFMPEIETEKALSVSAALVCGVIEALSNYVEISSQTRA